MYKTECKSIYETEYCIETLHSLQHTRFIRMQMPIIAYAFMSPDTIAIIFSPAQTRYFVSQFMSNALKRHCLCQYTEANMKGIWCSPI